MSKEHTLESVRRVMSRWLVSPLQGITLRSWWRVLADDRIAIHPEYWPRALSTGISSIVNSFHARREQRMFGARIATTEVKSPIFILGHYRSGTTHLHNLLAIDPRLAFPDYYQVNFPHTFMTTGRWGRRLGFLAPRKRPYDKVAVGLGVPAEDELALCVETLLSPHMGWHFPEQAHRYRKYLTLRSAQPRERARWRRSLLDLARKLSLNHGGRTLVLKSPCHTARVPLILETFPDARFVHIHRDPFRVFQSTHNMELRVGPLFQFQRRDLSGLDDHILWRYRTMYEAFLEDRARIPEGRLTEIAYRDLVLDPVGVLRRVYRDLDLPDFENARPRVERYLAELNGYETNVFPPLDARTRRRVAKEWGPLAAVWRYRTEAPRLSASG